jgi:hypothetical protein
MSCWFPALRCSSLTGSRCKEQWTHEYDGGEASGRDRPRDMAIPMRFPKIQVGNIVEIPTEAGYAYAQFTHTTDDGQLLRVFAALHEHPVRENVEQLASSPVQFVTFFPLQHAVNAGIVAVVGTADVPAEARKFPLFRMSGLPDPMTHKVRDWWLFDGQREWKIGPLTSEQRSLPIRETINDTLLKERIVAHWRHEDDS